MTGCQTATMSRGRFLAEALLIAVGGAAGGIARWQVDVTLGAAPWPWGTLLVNVAGSAGAGLLAGLLTDAFRARSSHAWWLRPLLVTGFLGGLTTFSAVIAETAQLAPTGLVSGVTVLAVNLGASLLAAILGLYTARRLTSR